MNVLFLMLCLCQRPDADSEIPEFKKLEVIIHVNEYNQNEALLKKTFTLKYIDRVNPKIKDTLTPETKAVIESLDKRTEILKEKMNISFMDRNRNGADFGFTIGSHSKKLFPLPLHAGRMAGSTSPADALFPLNVKWAPVKNESNEASGMSETGYWLLLFEFIGDDYVFPTIHHIWEKERNLKMSEYYLRETVEQSIFCANYLGEKLQKGEENWFQGKGGGLFQTIPAKDGQTETKYWNVSDLGYVSTVPIPVIRPEPKKPENPFIDVFQFSEKLD
jgi:hypothetical protein